MALLDHLSRLTRARVESALDEHGLRPRRLVALTLLRDHGGFSQQDLATALQMDKTNLVGLLNDLERDGFATRRRSPEDRRRHMVEISRSRGRQAQRGGSVARVVEDDVLGGSVEAERATLHEFSRERPANTSSTAPRPPRTGRRTAESKPQSRPCSDASVTASASNDRVDAGSVAATARARRSPTGTGGGWHSGARSSRAQSMASPSVSATARRGPLAGPGARRVLGPILRVGADRPLTARLPLAAVGGVRALAAVGSRAA